MLILGLQKTTLLDYPGKIASTIFTGGCNFRCPFCHNFELVENGLHNFYCNLKTNDYNLEEFYKEDLKNFIRTSKLYGFACECSLYCPTEEELEVTEENLKRYKELKDYIEEPEEPSMNITDTNMND